MELRDLKKGDQIKVNIGLNNRIITVKINDTDGQRLQCLVTFIYRQSLIYFDYDSSVFNQWTYLKKDDV